MTARSRGTQELAICIVLGAVAFSLSLFLAKPGRALSAPPPPAPRPTPPLSALSPPSAQAVVRKLLNSKAPPSAIWAALQDCDSRELAGLFHLTQSPYTKAVLMNRLLVLARWTEIDPSAAAGAASSQWDAFRNLPLVIGMWADLDPHAALDFVDHSGSGLSTGLAYTAAIASAHQQGRADLQSLFERLPLDQKGIEQTHKLVTGDRLAAFRKLLPGTGNPLTADHSNQFFAWFAEDLANNLLGEYAPSEIIGVYAEDSTKVFGDPSAELLGEYYDEDPRSATGWIFDRADPFEAARLGGALASGLIRTRPEEAATILERLPESATREDLMMELSESWRRTDRDAFESWWGGLEQSEQQRIGRQLEAEHEGTSE